MNKKNLWNIDWGLIAPVAVLLVLSLTTLFSLNPLFFRSQLTFIIVSLVVFVFFSQVNFKIIKPYSGWIYVISLIFLFFVLVLGIESRGSIRWIDIFGFRIQFSEILKPFLAISLASFLSSHNDYSLKTILKVFSMLLPVFILIFLQPDLGNALIYLGVVIFSLILFGFPLRYFLAGLAFVMVSIPIFWNFLHDYQKQRIITFINPGQDPLGISYNAIQSMIAIGSGMFLGKGFGQGTQSTLRFLPERHTDFIFATISEQLGFVGIVVLLFAFGYLFYKIQNIFINSNDLFTKIFTGIAFFLLLIQFFVNAGMNMGLLPIVGVTLPFVSYGGNSLLSNFIILGLLVSIRKDLKNNQVLEIK